MPGDASYSTVKLLLHCDGTDGSTTFTDNSPTPKTVTANGNAHIEVDQAIFGTASGAFDGSGDYLSLADSADWDYGTGDFTIETWYRFITAPVSAETQFLYNQRVDGTNFIQLNFSATKIAVSVLSGGSSILTFDGGVTHDNTTWNHAAFVRYGNVFTVYKNGTSVGSQTANITMPNLAAALDIGRWSGAGLYFNGYLDEIRITKGLARYTANFTPATEAFPHWAGQIAGVITDDASDPVARIVRAYRRDTGALVGNTTSSAADGSYSMAVPTLDECSVIALDDASGDVFNDLIARVTPA